MENLIVIAHIVIAVGIIALVLIQVVVRRKLYLVVLARVTS